MSAADLTGRWWLRINKDAELVMTVEEQSPRDPYGGYRSDAKVRDATIADVAQLGRMGKLGDSEAFGPRLDSIEQRISNLEMRPLP